MKPQLPDAAGAILRQALLSDGALGFYLDNDKADGDPVIFISTDQQWAQLSLVMQNNTTAQMSFVPSTRIEVEIWPLLTDDEIKNIAIAGSDWTLGSAVDHEGHSYLILQPVCSLLLAEGQTIGIQVGHVLASGAPGAGRIFVDYTGVQGVKDGSARLPAVRRLPPDQPNNWTPMLQLASRDEYGGPADLGRAIYTTPWPVTPTKAAIANTFVLEIGTGVDLSFESGAPCFTISFLTGESDTSLCSDAEIEIEIADIDEQPSASSPWTVTKDPNSNLPSFNVTPCTGTTTLSAGPSIGVRFSNLATTLPSGKSSPVLIAYGGIPKSNGGLAVVLLDKTDPVPFVRVFAPFVNQTPVGQGATIDFVPVKLKWDVFAAERCLIEPSLTVGGPSGQMDIALTEPTMTFTLQAQVGTREAAPVTTTFNVTPPKVGPITADPDAVAPNGGPSQLSWTCSNGDHCNVVANDGSFAANGLPVQGSVAVPVGAVDTTFTVTCVGAGQTGATHTIRVPPPEATISVSGSVWTTRGRSTEGVTTNWSYSVTWHTTYANGCTLMCPDTGQLLSNDLNGSISNSGSNFGSSPNCPRRFRVTAQGRGSASQDGSF